MKNKFDIILLKEKITRDKKKTIMFCVATVLFLYFDFIFLLGPQLTILKNVGAKIKNVVNNRRNLNKNLQIMQDFEKKQVQFGKDYFKPKKTFAAAEQPALLELVSGVANNYNLRLMQINAGPKESGPSAKLTGLMLSLELSGDYHALGKFLNELENSVANFTVSSMRITAGTQDIYRQNMILALKIYVKR